MFLYGLYFQISEIYEANKNTYLKQIFFNFSFILLFWILLLYISVILILKMLVLHFQHVLWALEN